MSDLDDQVDFEDEENDEQMPSNENQLNAYEQSSNFQSNALNPDTAFASENGADEDNANNDTLEDLFGELSDDDDDKGDADTGAAAAEVEPIFNDEPNANEMDLDADDGMNEAVDDTPAKKSALKNVRDFRDDSDLDSDDNNESKVKSQTPEIPQVVASLKIPKINPPGGVGTDTYLGKLPTFLTVDPKPFDKAALIDSLGGESALSALKKDPLAFEDKTLRLENTIRWRYKDTRTMEKDSNARIVRWSDGSFSLLLGEELFDCQLKSMEKDHHYLAARHAGKQPTTGSNSLISGSTLQIQARLKNTIMLVPSDKSGATHKRMAASIAKRHMKSAGTKLFANISHDPLQAKREAEKSEREMAKAAKKMRAERNKIASSFGDDSRGGGYGGSGSGGRRYDDFSDEEVDRRRRGPNLDAYEEDFVENDDEDVEMSDDSEEERRREAKLKASKKTQMRNRDEDQDRGSGSNTASVPTETPKKVATRRIIDSDDDDE
ncbi:hypothetical protein HDU81_001959 [Chytriomyces hyalinus]|nr:hypothetical protein HDU81_001959 [Chytriomyces hyalinus]